MRVENKIRICSIDGKDTVVGEKKELSVRNVWNRSRLIELQIGDGEKITVHENELLKAIKNATDNEFN